MISSVTLLTSRSTYRNSSETILFQGLMHILTFGGLHIYEQFRDISYFTFGHYNSSETVTFQGLMHIFTVRGLHI